MQYSGGNSKVGSNCVISDRRNQASRPMASRWLLLAEPTAHGHSPVEMTDYIMYSVKPMTHHFVNTAFLHRDYVNVLYCTLNYPKAINIRVFVLYVL